MTPTRNAHGRGMPRAQFRLEAAQRRAITNQIKLEKRQVREKKIGDTKVKFVTPDEYNQLWFAHVGEPNLRGEPSTCGWNQQLAEMGYTNLVVDGVPHVPMPSW